MWACRRLCEIFNTVQNKKIAVLGLTYKVGTDTLRRSLAIDNSLWLYEHGAIVIAYDPALRDLPPDLTGKIKLELTAQAALRGADAVIIANKHPDFSALTNDMLAEMKQKIVLDPEEFLAKQFRGVQDIQYFSVGRSKCN